MLLIVALVEGVLVGGVYEESFACFAAKLAAMMNKKLWQDHESVLINYT